MLVDHNRTERPARASPPGRPLDLRVRSAEAGDAGPGGSVGLDALAGDGRLDQAVGAVGGVEDLVRVVQAERGQVRGEVVLVRAGELDLVDAVVLGDDRLTHLVEGVLQRARIALGERGQQSRLDPVIDRVEVEIGGVVTPPGRHVGGQDAILGLGQGGVLVLRVPHEARSGRLHHGQPVEAADHGVGRAVANHDRGADLGRAAVEAVVVVVDPVPAELLSRPAAAGDPVEFGGEVLGQPEQVLLR